MATTKRVGRKVFGFVCFMALHWSVGLYGIAVAETSRINCRDKIDSWIGCVNKTISQKHSPGSNLQLIKMRINECLQKSKCARMYLDVQSDDGGDDEAGVPSTRVSRTGVMQCMRDFHDYSMPLVEKCVSQVVPDAAFIKREHRENKWTLLQQAMNKTQLQKLCSMNGSVTNAEICIDRLFAPNDQARRKQEQRFKEFCNAAHQCLIGMGVCRTELDNGRKAMCDCKARIFEQFDTIRPEVPSCAEISSDAIKKISSRRFHSPFADDCGPDPCDSSFENLTRPGSEQKGTGESGEVETETRHQ